MSSILDMVQQQLGGDRISQISQQIGTDPSTTQTAVQAALPMLLGGLAHNTTQPGGAESLHRALDEHTGTLDNLGGILGGLAGMATGQHGTGADTTSGGMGGLGGLLGSAMGGKILGHIFGQRQAPVEQGISKATGMDPQQVGKLLMILAPIVLGVLARKKQQDGLTPAQLGTEIQQNQAQVQQQVQQQGGGLLGGLLGQVFGQH